MMTGRFDREVEWGRHSWAECPGRRYLSFVGTRDRQVRSVDSCWRLAIVYDMCAHTERMRLKKKKFWRIMKFHSNMSHPYIDGWIQLTLRQSRQNVCWQGSTRASCLSRSRHTEHSRMVSRNCRSILTAPYLCTQHNFLMWFFLWNEHNSVELWLNSGTAWQRDEVEHIKLTKMKMDSC